MVTIQLLTEQRPQVWSAQVDALSNACSLLYAECAVYCTSQEPGTCSDDVENSSSDSGASSSDDDNEYGNHDVEDVRDQK